MNDAAYRAMDLLLDALSELAERIFFSVANLLDLEVDLEGFHRYLKRREIYAEASTRWRNPQARLLDGAAWEAVKSDVLTSLGLPETPDALLGAHVSALDEALRYVGGRLCGYRDVRVDEAGKIHVSGDKAIAEPPSLLDLRKRVAAMLPRLDIGELILEVMGWVPEFMESLTALSGGVSRMAGLETSPWRPV